VPLETSVSATAFYTDPTGISTSYTAVLDWGDDTPSSCTYVVPGVPGPDDVSSSDSNSEECTVEETAVKTEYLVTGSHTYTDPGVFPVVLTVTNSSGASDTSRFEYVVVYDPAGGFVTGGGWIDSPENAYQPAPTLTGKATFGFVSKYKKGASTPTGNTQFQFKAGDMNFHSDTYQWLVINQGGSRAQFKGTGTINGQSSPNGDYKFQLWATDGDPDTFRIKIWSETTDGVETVVYDNGVDQAIGGGSIVVHTGKKK
jgi:PKD repeat protein